MTTNVFEQATDFFTDDIIPINSCTFLSNSSHYELDESKITLISFRVDVINERFCILILHFSNQLWVFQEFPENGKCVFRVSIFTSNSRGMGRIIELKRYICYTLCEYVVHERMNE